MATIGIHYSYMHGQQLYIYIVMAMLLITCIHHMFTDKIRRGEQYDAHEFFMVLQSSLLEKMNYR